MGAIYAEMPALRVALLGVGISACLAAASCAWAGPQHPPLPNARPAFHAGEALSARRPTLEYDLRRRTVAFRTNKKPGTIFIDSKAKHLYFILRGNRAIRYSIGVGREGFAWTGTVTIGRKAKWPMWTPTAAMIRREPDLAEFASGMPGGRDNPLGARALYLYKGGRDTMYRIHGTNEPWTIGQALSSGCIRMMNDDIVELYDLVRRGAKVVVR